MTVQGNNETTDEKRARGKNAAGPLADRKSL
jgi:hypothetical protein